MRRPRLLRYPGSKAKLVPHIMRAFPDQLLSPLFQHQELEYIEPFVGGGAVALRVLDALRGARERTLVRLYDKDPHLVCLWNAIIKSPDELAQMVRDHDAPTTDDFYRCKEEDGTTIDPIRAGFQKILLHQLGFGGLGWMAGGPLGGRDQSSEYNVACRWNPSRIAHDIKRIHSLLAGFKSVSVRTQDFTKSIAIAGERSFVYADPPYYTAGPQLYKHAFDDADHVRLADALRVSGAEWVLSYDDHPFIRDLYSWAQIDEVAVRYTVAVARDGSARRKNNELLIRNPVREAVAAE